MPGRIDRNAILRGGRYRRRRIGDGGAGKPCRRAPAVHQSAARAIGRSAPYKAVRRIVAAVHGGARAVDQRERLFIGPQQAAIVAQCDGGAVRHIEGGIACGSIKQGPAGTHSINGDGDVAVQGPPIAVAVVQPKLIITVRGGGDIVHLGGQLYGCTASGGIRPGVHQQVGRDRYCYGGVVSASEVIRGRVHKGMGARG